MNPDRLNASSDLIEIAFALASEARSKLEGVAPQLHRDLNAVHKVIKMSHEYGLTEPNRPHIIDLMNTGSFKTVIDHVNTLMEPDIYGEFAHAYPNSALAYLKLQAAIGQLEQAIHPATGVFALSDGPVVR